MNIKRYLIVAALASILVLPTVSFAQSAAEIQVKIEALLAQIQQLQARLDALQKTQTQWCHTFNTNLRVEDRGTEIAALQTALSRAGSDTGTGSSDPTPLFNEYVAAAVTDFQEKYKDEILTPLGLAHGTGYVGPSTRKKLNQLYGCGNVKPPLPTTISWQTYIWEGYSFKYPSNWMRELSFYQTPGQQAEGAPAEVVGFYIGPKNQLSSADVIGVGGRQFDCIVAGADTRCRTVYGIPIYTKSTNPEILKVFETVVSSVVPVGTVCTQDIKQCPDGSYVGRTGPKCEFAACSIPPPPLPTTTQTPPPTIKFNQISQNVSLGVQGFKISWISGYVDSCSASGAWSGSRPANGEEVLSFNQVGDYTYALICVGKSGEKITESIVIKVIDTTPKTTFSFNGNESATNTYTTKVGDTVRLGWSTQNSYGGKCTASGDWSGEKSSGNSENITFGQLGTFNYILTCMNGASGERGTNTATIAVTQ